MIGLNPAARLSLFNRTLSRCMGLWGDGQTLYLSTLSFSLFSRMDA